MSRVYYVFDKVLMVNIIIGIILGIYLGFNHDSSNLWFDAIPFIIIISIIMTIPPILDVFVSKEKHKKGFPTRAIIEAFLLNVASLAVCTAFGVVIGSFIIGNYITN